MARTAETDAVFKARMKEAVQGVRPRPVRREGLAPAGVGMHYVGEDYSRRKGEDPIVPLLAKLDRDRGTAGNRVFYLAVPRTAIGSILDRIGARLDE